MTALENVESSPQERADERIQCFPAGQLLVREGECSRKMFIIKKGKARVFRKYLGQHVTLAVLGDGEIFGEMSFFDAEPRSASVETLTELSAIVVDGAHGAKQIAELPGWVHTIFRTVAGRFRRLDQQVTMLQSVYEFQKKSFNLDHCSQTIYSELLRFSKTLGLVYKSRAEKDGKMSRDEVYSEVEGLLGSRYLSLRVFWNLLKEHEIVENVSEETDGVVTLSTARLAAFEHYLESQMTDEGYTILSHSALAVLRRILSVLQGDTHSPALRKVNLKELQLNSLYSSSEALVELSTCKILTILGQEAEFRPGNLLETYTWQSIIKSFDYATVKVE